MSGLIDWTRRHQVVAFFAITFAITWGLGFSWAAIIRRHQFLLLPLAFVATCGPGLAGILVAAAVNARPLRGPRKTFWTAFVVGWLVSVLVCLANSRFIQHRPLSAQTVGLFTVAALPVAFVIASAHSRIPEVRDYLRSLTRPRGVRGWVLLGLVLFPALHLISILVNQLLPGGSTPSATIPDPGLALAGLVAVKFLYQFFFFNATGEETGWRGFALPRLQSRTSPLIAALIIALFWAPWHLFLWRATGSPVSSARFWLYQYSLHVPSSLFLVWIFNRAGGSILVAGTTHAAANTVMAFVPLNGMRGLYLTWGAATLAVILIDKMWRRLPYDHPAAYKPIPAVTV